MVLELTSIRNESVGWIKQVFSRKYKKKVYTQFDK